MLLGNAQRRNQQGPLFMVFEVLYQNGTEEIIFIKTDIREGLGKIRCTEISTPLTNISDKNASGFGFHDTAPKREDL